MGGRAIGDHRINSIRMDMHGTGGTLPWGDPAASLLVPLVEGADGAANCYGLLNICTGYVGWWRLDEPRGKYARDCSLNGLIAERKDGVEYVVGEQTNGANFSGKSYLEVPFQQPLALEEYTVARIGNCKGNSYNKPGRTIGQVRIMNRALESDEMLLEPVDWNW